MIMSRTVSKTQTPDATHTCEYKSRGAPTAYVSQSDCDKLNYGLDGVLIMSLVIVLSSFIGSKGWNPFHKKQQP